MPLTPPLLKVLFPTNILLMFMTAPVFQLSNLSLKAQLLANIPDISETLDVSQESKPKPTPPTPPFVKEAHPLKILARLLFTPPSIGILVAQSLRSALKATHDLNIAWILRTLLMSQTDTPASLNKAHCSNILSMK